MKFFEKIAKKKDKDLNSLIAGGAAGIGSSLLLNPIDNIHQKSQNIVGKTDSARALAEAELKAYKNSFKNIKTFPKAYAQGYPWKGLKVGAATAVSFALYNRIKNKLDELK